MMSAPSGGDVTNVEDVFSTYLYTGTGSSQTITNDIDLSGQGGFVWMKARSTAESHILQDTDGTGVGNVLVPNIGSEMISVSGTHLSAFNSNGFSIGTSTDINRSGTTMASWTFRKAPKFLDIVTYTGNGTSGRTVDHNLGSTPGMMIIKSTSDSSSWAVFHRDMSINSFSPDDEDWGTYLTGTNAQDSAIFWNNTAPTSTQFTLGNGINVNGSGRTYVAFLFAHNDGDGEFGPTQDQDIIKCGTYTGNGSTNGPEIDLGFEPQWILTKNITYGGNWLIFDVMRGVNVGQTAHVLVPNGNFTEADLNGYAGMDIQPTGFKINQTYAALNGDDAKHIYLAIRRGPMAVPESADEVFNPTYAYEFDVDGNTSSSNGIHGYLGNPTDLYIQGYLSGSTNNALVRTRLTGANYLRTSTTSAESVNTSLEFWDNNVGSGFETTNSINTSLITWNWRRAPNYFDVVAYTGNNTAGRTVSHNLGVEPEMIWFKKRNLARSWYVHHDALGLTNGLVLNSTSAEVNINSLTAKSATDITLTSSTNVNDNGHTYIAYLFASLDGISKVGNFTTTGSDMNIDCGFTNGARFVLLKRTDTTDDWFVWDGKRGIVAGNDPRFKLNSTAAQATGADNIDPYSAGFTLLSNIQGGSGNSFIFYAIA